MQTTSFYYFQIFVAQFQDSVLNLVPQLSDSDWTVLIITAIVFFALFARRIDPSKKMQCRHSQVMVNVCLRSTRLGLVGRPSCIVKRGKVMIPEEWTGSTVLDRHHLSQIGKDFVLIEEQFGVRPPYGYVVQPNLRRYRVRNDKKIRSWVLLEHEKIKQDRARVN